MRITRIERVTYRALKKNFETSVLSETVWRSPN